MKQRFKQIGFVGITNIPLYETNCKDCNIKYNTSTKREYCLNCRPIPIKCN